MKTKRNKTAGGTKKLPPIEKRIDMLVERLSASDDETFERAVIDNPGRAVKYQSKNARYVFIDNGASILAVAHVDTVKPYSYTTRSQSKSFTDDYEKCEDGIWRKKKSTAGKTDTATKQTTAIVVKAESTPEANPLPKVDDRWITSIKLDDRLGVHIILDILPMLGVECDVLLTDDEESGMSTASCFEPPLGKKYKWAFSFDRRGVGECVMYQYDSDRTACKLLEKAGWYLGIGSYSDIADLDIDCVGFNFSAGYWDEHTSKCSCHYDSVMYSARMFKRFYDIAKNINLPFDSSSYSRYDSVYGYSSHYTGKGWNKTKNYTGTTSTLDSITRAKPSAGIDCYWCGRPAAIYTRNYTPLCADCYDDSDDDALDLVEKSAALEDTPPEGTICIYCDNNEAIRWDTDINIDGRAPICGDCYQYYMVGCRVNMDGDEESDDTFECWQCGSTVKKQYMDDEIPDTCTHCADWLRDNYRDDELEYTLSKRNNLKLLTYGNGG